MKIKYVMGFWVWVTMMVLAMLAMGCSTDYSKGWSWGVLTEDGDMETMKHLWSKKESRIDDLPMKKHDDCKIRHYTDPYSKLEYCLPVKFWDEPGRYNLNNYRVLCN